ncbi:hypothetical protein G5T42_07705 [Microbacterium sp. 4R-513]|uniref:glycoside hydrolase family 99-like domain-containing protein n=1 Tax=Microbacterium sp. 4R-513 TaxID=2567934 RepID=UPI0013E0FC30|nr:glycoside hydrolase family 99-like domain-containing protein [Microbacterium sp. 4R-513]QIG39380.1 hypothetical protein G5T42_07705 [Microbacterium sp. 4R-513]
MRPTPKVLAYYFPNYHVDPRNERWFGQGWTEWDIVAAATPRFQGHQQPKRPMLGAFDESDPSTAEAQIELARRGGLDGFIFDHYWYEDGPFLNGALEKGFFGARNFTDIEFSIMWANHDYVNIFPSSAPHEPAPLLARGEISADAFRQFFRYVIANYFSRPNHTRIEGRPRFSIYEPSRFIRGVGGRDVARHLLREFDDETRRAGHEGVHIDFLIWDSAILPTDLSGSIAPTDLEYLGVASASSYVWIHHMDHDDTAFPVGGSWTEQADRVYDVYERYAQRLPVPFFPNVTVGWDSSPRTNQARAFQQGDYPWISAWRSTPAEFEAALKKAIEFARRHHDRYSEISINAWNEWTEGSYLLPDSEHGYAYLDAIAALRATV